jgi:hypothetical protein
MLTLLITVPTANTSPSQLLLPASDHPLPKIIRLLLSARPVTTRSPSGLAFPAEVGIQDDRQNQNQAEYGLKHLDRHAHQHQALL